MFAQKMPEDSQPVRRALESAGQFENGQGGFEIEFSGPNLRRHHAFCGIGPVLDINQPADRR